MIKFLSFKHLVADGPYQPYRKAIWMYLILLIFEGALRKWGPSALATPLLLARDPIAIWLTCAGLSRGWIKSGYANVMMLTSSICVLTTLAIGHQNLFVALFGWRIYFFHFPMIFIMGKVMTRDDLMKMARFVLLLSIPMTMLIAMQFRSPQSSWVNMGVGGEESSGFSGGSVGGVEYFRPSGTFSFTSGYVLYQSLVGCLLFYYLIMNDNLLEKYKLKKWQLLVVTVCYLLAIPMSISRTNVFQTAVFAIFLFLAVMRRPKLKGKFLKFAFLGAFAFAVISFLGLGGNSMDVLTNRLTSASEAEGGLKGTLGDRYAGGMLGAFINTNIPFFGYGIGLGTNVGAKIMGGNMYSFGFNAENEWERMVGESGLLLGSIMIGVRLFLGLSILRKAYFRLKKYLDMLPWMLSSAMILSLPQGQMSIPTNLGFIVVISGFALVAANSTNCFAPSKRYDRR